LVGENNNMCLCVFKVGLFNKCLVLVMRLMEIGVGGLMFKRSKKRTYLEAV